MPVGRIRALSSVERFFQFSLLGLVASGFFALAGSRALDRPTLVLTLLGLTLRGFMVAGWVRLVIPGKLISAAALGYVAFYPLDYYFLSRDFFTATLHGVCFLAAVKILTSHTNRDYLYTAIVAFLELIGAAMLSFSSAFFGWLALYMLFAIAAFTSAEIRRGFTRNEIVVQPAGARVGWRLAMVTGAATLAILAITGGLFLVVPRTARAAAMLFPYGPRVTGFSNVVDLGGFGEISTDTQPVMHVLSYSGSLPRGIKWRGAALSVFNGKQWLEPPFRATLPPSRNQRAQVADTLQLSRRDGHRLVYRVDVNNSDTGTLFLAGTPEYINFTGPWLAKTAEDAYRVLPGTGGETRYEASAHWGPQLPSPVTIAGRIRYLRLPEIDPRIPAKAREWTAGSTTDEERARRIEEHLRHEFQYTLESANHPVRDPLANFLFVTKRGYCEYFASAMAVMLRTLGIPSRVATGFQSGYFNEVSGMTVVRASDAHAWVEAWIRDGSSENSVRENLGRWTTFDPTPSGEARSNTGIAGRINMYLDAAESLWQQWVMAYDLGHQVMLATKFEGTLRKLSQARLSTPGSWTNAAWSGLRSSLAWTMGSLALLGVLFFGAPSARKWLTGRLRANRIARKGASSEDASLLYEQMLDVLARRGFRKPAWFTPQEFARTLPGAESAAIRHFTDLYYSVRFGGDSKKALEMIEMLRQLNG